ncbi:porin [Roseateles sp. GG27B]
MYRSLRANALVTSQKSLGDKMKKNSVVLCALVALTGAVQAQSSVSISGVIDLAVGKDQGNSNARMGAGDTNTLAFNGKEDLGGGMKAVFELSTRINPDSGQTDYAGGGVLNASMKPFWTQAARVALQNSMGEISLGRQFSPALGSQAAADPWGWRYVTSGFGVTSGGIANVWYNHSVAVYGTVSGVSLGALIAPVKDNPGWGQGVAGQSGNGGNDGLKTPYAMSASFTAAGLTVLAAYEKPADGISSWSTVTGLYSIGTVRLNGFFGSGKNTASQNVRSVLVASVIPVGNGEFRVSYGTRSTAGTTDISKISGAYWYNLSKRTSVYVNLGHDTKASTAGSSLGAETGIRHAF